MTTFPTAPPKYLQLNEQVFRDAVLQALNDALKAGATIELPAGATIIWVSPDGTRWSVGIEDTGALVAESL